MAGHGLVAVALLVLLAAVAPASAVDYTVGDSSGWASGVDYDTWAQGKTFKVGDSIVFQYSMMHTVAEVSLADYSGCSASNSIQSYSDQNTKIALTKPGTRYFICGATGHCAGGMKLAVTVSPVAATASPAASPPAAPALTPSTPLSTPSEPGVDAPSEATPSTSTSTPTQAATTTTSAGSTGRASGGEARLLMGLLVGAVGLVGIFLMG